MSVPKWRKLLAKFLVRLCRQAPRKFFRPRGSPATSNNQKVQPKEPKRSNHQVQPRKEHRWKSRRKQKSLRPSKRKALRRQTRGPGDHRRGADLPQEPRRWLASRRPQRRKGQRWPRNLESKSRGQRAKGPLGGPKGPRRLQRNNPPRWGLKLAGDPGRNPTPRRQFEVDSGSGDEEEDVWGETKTAFKKDAQKRPTKNVQ